MMGWIILHRLLTLATIAVRAHDSTDIGEYTGRSALLG